VTIDPSSVTLSPGQSQQFTAIVTNSANGAVIWSTDPPNIGTLSQTGRYTAPATIPAVSENRSITILAVSAANPTKQGSAMVSLIS
jgi:chitinase